jgi:hypothetical protein
MFYTLLLVTFAVAAFVSAVAARAFSKSADAILKRIIQDEVYVSWLTYLKFAIHVVGISSGVRLMEIERYVNPPLYQNGQVQPLTGERWVLEVYRCMIETLQGIAWVLLAFFAAALIAFVIVRASEAKRSREEKKV